MSTFDGAAFQRFELTGWSRKSSGYHRFYEPLTTPVIAALLDAVVAASGSRVLDVGSGPGYVLAAAEARNAWTVGVDQAEPMGRLARTLRPGARYLVADAQRLPLRTGSMTAVVGNFVLHHLPFQHKALVEWARVLVPGGRLALTIWDRPDKCRYLGVFNEAVAAAGATVPASVPSGPAMVAHEDAYVTLLGEAGFDDVRIRTLHWDHDFGSPDLLWDGLLASSVRTAALITEQAPDVQMAIRARYDEIVASYREAQRFAVPVSVLLMAARRS